MKSFLPKYILSSAAFMAFPLFIYVQILVGAAGHAMMDGNFILVVFLYSLLTGIMILKSNQFYRIYWFYRFFLKVFFLTSLIPLIYFPIMFLYEGIVHENNVFPDIVTIPISVIVLLSAVLFLKDYFFNKIENK